MLQGNFLARTFQCTEVSLQGGGSRIFHCKEISVQGHFLAWRGGGFTRKFPCRGVEGYKEICLSQTVTVETVSAAAADNNGGLLSHVRVFFTQSKK